jgi:YfiH family protein
MEFQQFSSLQRVRGLRHAITTRGEGASVGDFASLNLGFHVGDDADAVRENRVRVAQSLVYDPRTVVAAQQVHGDAIAVATSQESGRGALDWESAMANTDALIVAEAELPAMILVADCAPILVADPEHNVLAVVHAGWRGAVAGIAGKSVRRMQEMFDTQPQSTLVGIGPCLCNECLEVGEEVATQIESTLGEPQSTFVQREEQWPKPHLNLRELVAHDLEKSGVPRDNIEILNECPRCMNEKYFSHRGQNGKAGRFGLVAWWE